jgi:NAD(P)-dependent dehydrogenase (short-subunit alcohol dehydrogenase family)
MTRGILIAGNDSALSAAVAAEAARRVERFVCALIPNRISELPREKPAFTAEACIPLAWNPGSPISARTLILSAENRLERIDEAVLVCSPPSIRRFAGELVPTEIEIMVNDHIKGWFFLAKEAAALFRARGGGTLALVLSDISPGNSKDETVDLLGPSAAASFRAFFQGLLSSSLHDPYQTMAFTTSETGTETAFAAFIFKILEESNKRNNGKWHKFGRLNLFGK